MFVRQGRSSGVADLLCRRGLVVTFCDLTTVPRNNAWVPFGRIETLVNLGPALIALRNQAPLLVLVSRVLPAGKTGVWIQPLLPPVDTGNNFDVSGHFNNNRNDKRNNRNINNHNKQ